MAGLLEFAARFAAAERRIAHLAGLRWPAGLSAPIATNGVKNLLFDTGD
jgi:hypothetical protein